MDKIAKIALEAGARVYGSQGNRARRYPMFGQANRTGVAGETAAYAVRLCRSRRLVPVTLQHRRRESAETASVSSTDAKNEIGRILEKAIQGATVVITKHDAPKAVLMSVDQFNDLSRSHRVEIEALSNEFDDLLARMQTPAARVGMNAAFEASPKQLGRAAMAAARKRV